MAAASTQPDDGRAHSAPQDRSQAGSAHPAAPPGPVPSDPAATLATARYVSLTTFRRTGEPVATPVWIAPADRPVGSGDPRSQALVTISMADAGKVKRLRRDSRVELQVCDVRGRVRPHTPVYSGTAVLQRSDGQVVAARQAMARKYLLARVGAVVQRVLGSIRPGKPRVAIRITVADPPPRSAHPPLPAD